MREWMYDLMEEMLERVWEHNPTASKAEVNIANAIIYIMGKDFSGAGI